jgi:hypothetical protein
MKKILDVLIVISITLLVSACVGSGGGGGNQNPPNTTVPLTPVTPGPVIPVISTITPTTYVPSNSQSPIVVNGTNFNAPTISFTNASGVSASATVNSSSSTAIAAVTPVAPENTFPASAVAFIDTAIVEVTVANADGAISNPVQFTYVLAPTIYPNVTYTTTQVGNQTVLATITIPGVGLEGTTDVIFSCSNNTSVSTVTPSSVTAPVPSCFVPGQTQVKVSRVVTTTQWISNIIIPQ